MAAAAPSDVGSPARKKARPRLDGCPLFPRDSPARPRTERLVHFAALTTTDGLHHLGEPATLLLLLLHGLLPAAVAAVAIVATAPAIVIVVPTAATIMIIVVVPVPAILVVRAVTIVVIVVPGPARGAALVGDFFFLGDVD